MCSALATWREPWNMTCSNRCAKPVLPGDLVLGADVVPEVDRDDRREVVLGDDHAQAVVETLVAEGDLGDGGGHGDLSGSGFGRRGPHRIVGDDRTAFGPGAGSRPARRMVPSNVCRLAGMMLQNPIRRVATLVLAAALAVLLVPGARPRPRRARDRRRPPTSRPSTNAGHGGLGHYIERMKMDGSTLVVKLVGGGTVAEGGVDPG